MGPASVPDCGSGNVGTTLIMMASDSPATTPSPNVSAAYRCRALGSVALSSCTNMCPTPIARSLLRNCCPNAAPQVRM